MPNPNEKYWWKDKQGVWHLHRPGTPAASGAVATSTTNPNQTSTSSSASGTGVEATPPKQLPASEQGSRLPVPPSKQNQVEAGSRVPKEVSAMGNGGAPKSTLKRKGTFPNVKKPSRAGDKKYRNEAGERIGGYNFRHKKGELRSRFQDSIKAKVKKGPKMKTGAAASVASGASSSSVKPSSVQKSPLYTAAARGMGGKKKKRGYRP